MHYRFHLQSLWSGFKSANVSKATLLDQKRVAGVGNLYASEILHLARIHPAILVL